MNYLHGVGTSRNTSISTDPSVAPYGLQCVIGTAPINTLDDPAGAVNKPILVSSRKDFKKYFGESDDVDSYTLVQSEIASFRAFAVAPVVFINVLDPSKSSHITVVASAQKTLTGGAVTIEQTGILLSTVKVTDGSTTTYKEGDDYTLSFDDSGYVVLTATSTGDLSSETVCNVGYTKLNPSGVTALDIVGGTSATGVKTGIDVIDEVYSTLGVVCPFILAPGWSKNPTVAAALETKAEIIGSLINAQAIVDINISSYPTINTIANGKTASGVSTRWAIPTWGKVLVNGYYIDSSAILGALMQNICIKNNGVPGDSPDNQDIPISALCKADNTEIHLTMEEANDYANAYGVVTFIYMNGWKAWGNNTAAYPGNKNPNDRFIKCVAIGNYIENRFKTQYLSTVGRNGSTKLIKSVVSNFNADLNALVDTYVAGAEVVFSENDNPMSEMLEGRYTFRTRYADWTPIEYLENVFTWDSTILQEAFGE